MEWDNMVSPIPMLWSNTGDSDAMVVCQNSFRFRVPAGTMLALPGTWLARWESAELDDPGFVPISPEI